MGYATNRELKASIPRDVSVRALARQMRVNRTDLNARLNNDDTPSEAFVRQIKDAVDAIQKGVPTQ